MTTDSLHRGNHIAKELKDLYKIRESLKGILDSEQGPEDFSRLASSRQSLGDILFRKQKFRVCGGNFDFPDLAEAWNKEFMRAIFFMHSEVEAKIKSLETEFENL